MAHLFVESNSYYYFFCLRLPRRNLNCNGLISFIKCNHVLASRPRKITKYNSDPFFINQQDTNYVTIPWNSQYTTIIEGIDSDLDSLSLKYRGQLASKLC